MIEKNNLKVGNMVVIKEVALPDCKQLLGSVVAKCFATDCKARVVIVKTQNGIFKSAVSKKAILPLDFCF